jgi:dynein heavy chain
MNASKEHLSSALFCLCPPLREALLNVRSTSMPMASMGMLSLPVGEIFDHERFVEVQLAVQADLRGKLDNLSGIVLSSVRTACDTVVDQFLKANNIAADHKMTFMERAALRAECRRLTRFLRMVDIMMTDFLMSMIKDAIDRLAHAAEPHGMKPRSETSDTIDKKAIAKKRLEGKLKAPLFRVVANFKRDLTGEEGEETMTLSPNMDELMLSINTVINESVDVVCSFVKVLSSPDTEMYVMPDGDGDEEEEDEEVSLADTINQSQFFTHSKDLIFRYVRHTFNAVRDYCNVFNPYRELYFKNSSYVGDVSELFASGEVEQFEKAIALYRGQIEQFRDVPRFADVGVLFVDSEEMKAQLTPSPVSCITAIRNWLPKLASMRAQELIDEIGNMNPVIGGEPMSVEAYVNKKKVKDTAANNIESYKDKQSYIKSLIFLMDDNQWPQGDDVKATLRMLGDGLVALEANITLAEGKEEEEGKKFATQITEEVPKLIKKINDIREQLDNPMISDPDAPDEKVVKYMVMQEQDFARAKARSEKLQEYQTVLRLNVDEFELLEEVNADLTIKSRLWKD